MIPTFELPQDVSWDVVKQLHVHAIILKRGELRWALFWLVPAFVVGGLAFVFPWDFLFLLFPVAQTLAWIVRLVVDLRRLRRMEPVEYYWRDVRGEPDLSSMVHIV